MLRGHPVPDKAMDTVELSYNRMKWNQFRGRSSIMIQQSLYSGLQKISSGEIDSMYCSNSNKIFFLYFLFSSPPHCLGGKGIVGTANKPY